MAKSLSIGNGTVLVNLDERAQVRDFYFPHVGLENQVGGHFAHRVGVWVDGQFSWTADPDWQVRVEWEIDFMAGRTLAENKRLGVRLAIQDIVYNEKNIFVRKVLITNLSNQVREIRLFFHQQFELYESHAAHTAYFDPGSHSLVHYRNQRVFLAAGELDAKPFDQFSTGLAGREGREGTYRDAEDGVLSGNPIEHGPVDSVLRLAGNFQAGEDKLAYYWLIAAKTIPEAFSLHQYVHDNGPGHLVQTTRDFWRAWVYRQNFSFDGLSKEVINLFNLSLFIIRAHVDADGAIIASADSNVLQSGKDTYCYTWMRDSSYAAMALTGAGSHSVAKQFFTFANQTITPEGYFLHKYSADGAPGSSWHAWFKNGEPQLPIQEDSTASVLFALWQFYEKSKDLEFVESIYNSLIKKAADFLVIYRDENTGLPKPSFDLWEEKWGVSTYTAAAVYGGLMAAANFAKVLGKLKSGNIYHKTALEIKEGILKYLYDEKLGFFPKLLRFERGEMVFDTTIDFSSVYGLSNFGVLSDNDPRLIRALEISVKKLAVKPIGGLARYDGDNYARTLDGVPGNPWIITTLWLAQHQVALAQTEDDLQPVKKWLLWATKNAFASGILPEQLHPVTGEPISVAPLVWSHAEFVRTVIAYLDKMEELGLCKACNPVY
ncbi:MAG: glycoside hydrolase family 15 protein [Patescibacteria group bacterium]